MNTVAPWRAGVATDTGRERQNNEDRVHVDEAADHSPVGELEDIGKLTEDEAMRHPRRNEVFRDVGSRLRDPHEEEFIEIKTVRFRPEAALLICSDGLSDVLTSAQIGAIVEGYD